MADHSTPASQSPHSSNPSSLPSSPPTHNHGAIPFSNFGPIGTPDSRERRVVDRWKTDKTGESEAPPSDVAAGQHGRHVTVVCVCASGAVSGFGLDYLPPTASDTSWHQVGPAASSWTSQESPMEETSSTVLLDSLKVS